MDLQYARLDATASALRASLELRARAYTEHSARNAVHELQAASCKHLWLLTMERKACTLHAHHSREGSGCWSFAQMQKGALHAVLQSMTHVGWSPADGLWMMCSRSSTSALEAYLASLNARAVSARTDQACLIIYVLIRCKCIEPVSVSEAIAFFSQDAIHTKRKTSTSSQPLPTPNKVTLLRLQMHGKGQ